MHAHSPTLTHAPAQSTHAHASTRLTAICSNRFAIEYLGRDVYYLPSALGMFAACEAYNAALPAGAKPFRLFVIINFCCGLNLTDAVELYTRFHASSCAHKVDGRPVFSSWSAVNSRVPFREEAARWEQGFYQPIQSAGMPRPFFLPFIYPANYSGDPAAPHVTGHCAEGTCPGVPLAFRLQSFCHAKLTWLLGQRARTTSNKRPFLTRQTDLAALWMACGTGAALRLQMLWRTPLATPFARAAKQASSLRPL